MRLPHRRLDENAAHKYVTADSAQSTPVDWPVSGDETLRRYGYDGQDTDVDIWHAPNVAPKIKTTGIRPGDTIRTWGRTGVVTRVGTIAGWFLVDGVEQRWDMISVVEIIPAGTE